ncbi:DNA mismatch repair endonuclease MutL [Bombilactobacillus folatiphilus]|uniref:DNA mismatch repair protein MutL n=1 Tax=Bombilactobacillus folatiphilus TaxID=2923362 RepID=A0ABY4PA08_9LACO|nr:DNA mismatch repair endonuclease MutL [Bombilactobacillus folatiphilus]UQS82447.1 DNA mismatch repair endonuclease MutL [Bombilactobacillus folatiphilus]
MAQIQKLTPTLSNQIAAGEVIERPASVVKELVENALDANASQIDIQIKDAGVTQITVADNGTGIASDQVELAFLPHATSKINSTQDLFNVKTLGFRGEALASIAAVAKVRIITSIDAKSGTQLEIIGGEFQAPMTVAATKGTIITVEDLFYNTPVRLKYIKTLNTELKQVVDIVNRLALGHAKVAFTLTNEKKTLIRTSGNGDVQQAMAGIYGRKTAADLVACQAQDADFTIKGYTSLPKQTRANRNYLSLLVNGRYINNYQLSQAWLAGYGSKLMVGRYPLGVLQITAAPLLVDVNVHPTKREVRLSKEQQLAALVEQAVSQALESLNLIPDVPVDLTHKKQPVLTPLTLHQIAEPAGPPQVTEQSLIAPDALHWTSIFDDPKHLKEWDERLQQATPVCPSSPQVPDFAAQLETNAGQPTFPQLQFLAQIHETYLVAQSSDGFYLVDQHAAQERVKYEQYRVQMGQVSAYQQKLLVPLILDYSNADTVTLSDHLDLLKQVGVEIAPFGQNSFVVTAHPAWIPADQEEATIREMIDYILQDGKIDIAKFREQTAITMSCKLSIKANHHLDQSQAQAILDQLAQTKNPYNCSHGRPTLIHFSDQDVQKMFKRIQDPHQSRWKKRG